MLDNHDKNEIMKMMKQLKEELRAEFNANSNTHSNTENVTNVNVDDNTNAILELAEIVGGGE